MPGKSANSTKPGMLSWTALFLGIVLFYFISMACTGFLVFRWNAPEQILLPFLPIKWLVEYLVK
jgi:hypothetical protein